MQRNTFFAVTSLSITPIFAVIKSFMGEVQQVQKGAYDIEKEYLVTVVYFLCLDSECYGRVSTLKKKVPHETLFRFRSSHEP